MTTALALLMALVLLVGVTTGVAGVRSVRRVPASSGLLPLVVPAVCIGFAALCLSLFLAAFWHVGGREGVSDDGNPYRCSAWWMDAASPRGAAGDLADPPYCHRRAIDAIPPIVDISTGVGIGVGAGSSGWLALRRRRFARALRRLAES